MEVRKKKVVKILSVDGGGVRGVIPISILALLEDRLFNASNKGLIDCFDIFAGTSVGALIVMLLNMRDKYKLPIYHASMISRVMDTFAKTVFERSFWYKIKSGNGLFLPKYEDKNLNDLLSKYFGSAIMSNMDKPIIVPAYSVARNTTVLFRKNFTSESQSLYEVARSTCAAPTYFNPYGSHNQLIDGGITLNNPTMSAILYAHDLYPNHDLQFVVISLGTGVASLEDSNHSYFDEGLVGWAPQILSILLDSSSCIAGEQVTDYLDPPHKYFRFNTALDQSHMALDNASDENIEYLKSEAFNLFNMFKQFGQIDEIVELLIKGREVEEEASAKL